MRKDVDCDAYEENLEQEVGRVAVNDNWVFVLIDMVIFFLIFLMFRKKYSPAPPVFVESKQQSKHYPLTNTIFLLVSSWSAFEDVCAARRQDYRPVRQFLATVLVFGFVSVLMKVAEYYLKFATGITPITNGFYTFHFFAIFFSSLPLLCISRW